MSANQPRPTPNKSIDIQTLVMLDLVKRRAFGIKKYQTALQANNGRDALMDAYEESLDLLCYLKQMLAERDGIEVAEADKQTLTDLRLAQEIDKARDFLVFTLEVFIKNMPEMFAEFGLPLPQTYEVKDATQFVRDLRFKLEDVKRWREELDMLRERADGNYWVWQGDGLDHLESLTCPVIIQPQELLKFYLRWLEPDTQSAPIPMIMFCPRCGFQHVDEPEEMCGSVVSEAVPGCFCTGPKGRPHVHGACEGRWLNPPHKSHLCSNCKLVWRPADVETTGVEFIQTRGERDTWEHSASGPPQKMLEIGVEGDKFHPHDWNSDCVRAGCVPMPAGWKSPYDKKEVAPGHGKDSA